jgi:hypothetical protein
MELLHDIWCELGFKPSVKKVNKLGLVSGSSSNSFSADVGFDLSGQGVSSPSPTFSPMPKAVGSPGKSSSVPMASLALQWGLVSCPS